MSALVETIKISNIFGLVTMDAWGFVSFWDDWIIFLQLEEVIASIQTEASWLSSLLIELHFDWLPGSISYGLGIIIFWSLLNF